MQEKIIATKLLTSSEVDLAIEFLKRGDLVAFPTETVYGLGAPLFFPESIKKIFHAKGRPKDNPLITHVYSKEDVEKIAIDIPKEFYLLAEAFFPGPLTIVLEAHPNIPQEVSAGLPTIAVRSPNHPLARELLKGLEMPLVAPSANLSGKPSSTCAEHVLEDFEGKIAAVLDGGQCSVGLESTVIGLQNVSYPLLLRPGFITKEQIEHVLKRPLELPSASTPIVSPGMKYRHYAPNALVKLFFKEEDVKVHLTRSLAKKQILLSSGCCEWFSGQQLPLESSSLYSFLRFSDKMGCDEVLVLCSESALQDHALMNRLYRASEYPCGIPM